MKLYHNMGPLGQPKRELRDVKRRELGSIRAMERALETEAIRIFGIKGRDWEFRQNPRGYLIPILVVCVSRSGTKTGETITIE